MAVDVKFSARQSQVFCTKKVKGRMGLKGGGGGRQWEYLVTGNRILKDKDVDLS